MAATQEQREAAFFCPLGEDVLLLRRMTGNEALGRRFEYNLDLVSEDPNIRLEDLLGQNCSVRLDRPSYRATSRRAEPC